MVGRLKWVVLARGHLGEREVWGYQRRRQSESASRVSQYKGMHVSGSPGTDRQSAQGLDLSFMPTSLECSFYVCQMVRDQGDAFGALSGTVKS